MADPKSRVLAAAPGEHLGRDALTELMVKRAQPRLAELGIALIDVRIKRINYVKEVEQKVFERMISERSERHATEAEPGGGNARLPVVEQQPVGVEFQGRLHRFGLSPA